MHTDLINALRSTFSRFTLGEQDEKTFEVRYLGEWEVPQGEKDDGDYDWKVPTETTGEKLDAIADKFGYTWAYGEKEWIVFTKVTLRANPVKYVYPAGMSDADKRRMRAAARRAKKS